VPLRSVEAATRDDAIAAAREQFGPSARVVGVRRVRSGGVLGFFATERYVAEVAPDVGRPSVPVPAPSRADDLRAALRDAPIDDGAPSDFSSPLSSAAPARARTAAPPRNGAAAWAAEAARSADGPGPAGMPARTAPPARSFGSPSFPDSPFADELPARAAETPVHPAASAPRTTRTDAARVSEIAGLLAAQQAEPEVPTYSRTAAPRASFPRTAPGGPSSSRRDEDAPAPTGRGGDQRSTPADSDVPSPFTAALARMVAGDRDVQQAVREALEWPAGTPAAGKAEPRPGRGRPGPADSSGTSRPARQEEETVGDQVIAPSSAMLETSDLPEASEPMSAPVPQSTSRPVSKPVTPPVSPSVDVPTWAGEPDAAASTSSREEAIAEVLRSALAQGHSDEALAGILRKVLAGVSPQTALTEPEMPVPGTPKVVLADIAVPDVVPPAGPVAEAVVTRVPLPEAAPPAAAYTPPAQPVHTPVFEPAPAMPRYSAPRIEPLPWVPPGQTMWGEPALPSLWDDRTPVPVSTVPASGTADSDVELPAEPVADAATDDAELDAPIWAEVAAQEAAAADQPTLVDEPAEETAPVVEMFETAVAEETAAVEETVLDEAVPEETVLEEAVAEEAVAEDVIAEEVFADEEAVEEVAEEVVAEEVVAEDAVVDEAIADEAITEGNALEESVPEGYAGTEAVAPVADVSLAEEPIAESVAEIEIEAADEPAVEENAAEDAVEEQVQIAEAETEIAQVARLLARTASDLAPMMSLDATTVMPPLSLLPPLPSGRGRGRPPVPPAPSRSSASRPVTPPAPRAPEPPVEETASAEPDVAAESALAAAPGAPEAADITTSTPQETEAPLILPPATRLLATVTRLPVAPLMATPELPELPENLFGSPEPVAPATAEASVTGPEAPVEAPVDAIGDVAARLESLGIPARLLGPAFSQDVAQHGTYAALTRALALRLPQAPELPNGAGEVLFVVGPGVETLRAARTLATTLRLDPHQVQWATRGDLAGLAPEGSRITTIDAAIQRRQDAASAGSVTIVAVDAALRTDAYWMAQMTAIWAPLAVWAVVDATRKPEDLGPWIGGLPQVDALIVQDTDVSADPAAVLRVVDVPVAILDGVRATPHRWASLLCERLENTTA